MGNPSVELIRQPGAGRKPANEVCELCTDLQLPSCAGQGIPKLQTEFIERISVKFSRMASTVDLIEGSKNPDTSCLCMDRNVRGNKQGEGQVIYPVSANFPALIPYWGSLSLREPNLMYWVPLSPENTLFKPSSNFWAKAAMSSGVLNFDCSNFSGRR